MSLFKRLFGGKSPERRFADGERLFAEGEIGLARLEFEAVANAPDAPPELQSSAQARLAETAAALIRTRLDEALALAESGDAAGTRHALLGARALGASAADCANVEHQLERFQPVSSSRSAARPAARVPVQERSPVATREIEPDPEFDESEVEDSSPDDELAEESQGDEPLSPLEQALLPFPEPEAARLRALVAVDRRLGDALTASLEERWVEAARCYGVLREPAASDPLIRREAGRAALADRRPGEALVALEAARAGLPTDPETLELLMEARLAGGDTKGAAAVAREVLALGVPRDFATLVSVLFQGGSGEEALRQVDAALDRGRDVRTLWTIRAALCERMGSAEGVAEADAKVIEAWGAECRGCGSEAPEFPLLNARRLGETCSKAALAASGTRAERQSALDVVRLLADHDTEDRQRWTRLAQQLGG